MLIQLLAYQNFLVRHNDGFHSFPHPLEIYFSIHLFHYLLFRLL